jgi:hypothetical protein
VTCAYCQASLRVEHSASAVWTKAIEELAEGQRRIVEQQERVDNELERLELHNEREEAERSWRLAREKYGVRGGDGSLRDPSTESWAFWLCALIVFIGVVIVGNVTQSLAFTVVAMLVVFATMGVGYRSLLRNARNYQAARTRYEERIREMDARAGLTRGAASPAREVARRGSSG